MFGINGNEGNTNNPVNPGPAPAIVAPSVPSVSNPIVGPAPAPAPVAPPAQQPGPPLMPSGPASGELASIVKPQPPPPPPTHFANFGPPPPIVQTHPTPPRDDLIDIKQEALQHLAPLVEHLEQTPEEKFKTTMMMLQASDNPALVKEAYAAANSIKDEKARAQALLDVVNEINYFTHQPHPANHNP